MIKLGRAYDEKENEIIYNGQGKDFKSLFTGRFWV